jgi:hypothetical protein
MAGKLYSIIKHERFITFCFVFSLLLIMLFYIYKNQSLTERDSRFINFSLVKEEANSKYSIVELEPEDKVFATFTEYNKKYGKQLHKNNFWSPSSCSAMPNVFTDSNYLIVMEKVKKVSQENMSYVTNMFIYDYNKNTLTKSEDLNYIVGDMYKVNKNEVVYFTYIKNKLIKNIFNPKTLETRDVSHYEITEKDPTFRFYFLDNIFYTKVFSGEQSFDYQISKTNLVGVEKIPEREFWKISNEGNKVKISKNTKDVFLNKAQNEEYKILKVTDKNILVSKLDLSNFYNFQIEKINIDNGISKVLYSNSKIENNYFLINSE